MALAVGVPAVTVGTAVNVPGMFAVETAVLVAEGVDVTTGGKVGGKSEMPTSGAKNNKTLPAQ